ncbi:hypothetical protein DTO280E4_4489 [Paecilomyces variotii]|nr:hypothetical protein DTO280E4_4489 [Paecilomyces variotii]
MSMKRLIHDKLRISSIRSQRGSVTDGETQAGPHYDRVRPQGISVLVSATSRILTPIITTPEASKDDLWMKALRILSARDKGNGDVLKKILSETSRFDGFTDILIREVRAKRDICKRKKWTFEFNGRTISLGEQAEKVIQWLDKIKAVGDVTVNVDPIHAGLPWAGIRMLLIAVTSESHMMGTLLVGLDKVLYLIDRCKVYELLYPHNSLIEDSYQNFESALVGLYVVILDFLAVAVQTSKNNAIKRTLTAFWSLDCINKYDTRFQELMTRVEIEAHNCDRLYSRHERLVSQQQTRDLKRILRDLEQLNSTQGQIEIVKDRISGIWEFLDGEKRHEMLLWISVIPFEDHHRMAKEGRTEDTGTWLLRHDQYVEWQSSQQSTILWLHGIPGAGKTKLVSQVIDNLQHDLCEGALVYFYCNRNEESRRKPEQILRSFIKQLSISNDKKAIHQAFINSYDKRWQTGFSSRDPSLDECEKLITDLASTYPKVTFVLDALDETETRSRKRLFDFFNYLIEHVINAKIFISSRRDGDIKRQLERKANISIEATDNHDDIAKFVAERISENEKDRQYPISESLKSEIIDTLLHKSHGMFQWAALQVDQVLSLDVEQDICDRLGKLPTDLKSTYDEIYESIQTKGSKGSEAKVATRAFQWVMGAQTPLSANALLAAVWQEPGNNRVSKPQLDIQFVLNACHNLLVIDPVTRRCYFAHLSIREYFEENHPLIGQPHIVLTKVCLLLLIDDNVKAEEWPEPPLSSSGTIYKLTDDGELSWLTSQFFGSVTRSSSAYIHWFEYWAVDEGLFTWDIINQLQPISNPLLAICRFGLCNVLQWLWESDCDPNQVNVNGESLLLLTTLGSDLELVQMLLGLGADANRQSARGDYGTALAAAASTGSLEMVQLLLDAGSNVNQVLPSARYGSALAAAASSSPGSVKMVQLLLDAGADVNQKLSCGAFESDLAAAAHAGSMEIVQLLLDAGADVNQVLSSGDHGNALAVALYMGRVEMVRLLLDAGSDMHQVLPYARYGSALAAAAYSGPVEIVQLLLDAGADVNQKLSCGYYGSALAAAAYGGSVETVELLLDAGSDVNQVIPYGRYGSALAAAAYTGTTGIVQLLLDAGADVNQKLSCGYYGSALAAAAYGGSVETVQLLLDVGADVNQELSCGHYGMAVVAAIDGWDGDMAVVETLLDAGADISRLHTHLERTLVLRSQQPCEIRAKKGDAVKAQWPLV